MKTFKKLLFLLPKNERNRAGLILFLIVIMAMLDVIGVASILPFMAVLTNSSLIETNFILKYMFEASSIFGVENNEQFLFALGALVFIILVISLIFKALTTYLQMQFVFMSGYSIGNRLVEVYLHQPYSWFLNRHSADIGKTILSEVHQVISNGMHPLMDLIAKCMVTFALITLLIIVDPIMAITVGFLLGGAYGFFFFFLRRYLNIIGDERLKNNQLRFTAVSEAFGAAKEIKVGGLEQIYINSFSEPAKTFARTEASSKVIALLPRFILEAIAFGGILLFILYTMGKSDNFNDILPIVSLYVFTGYRLMPALQQIYSSFTSYFCWSFT